MSELVERLRWTGSRDTKNSLAHEAADRIEELERALRVIVDDPWALVPEEAARAGIGMGDDRWFGWAQDYARAVLSAPRSSLTS